MQITLLGLGGGTDDSLTREAEQALSEAELLLGSRRLLKSLPARPGQRRAAAVRPEEIAGILRADGASRACVVFSGDSGFWSGASALERMLDEAGLSCRVLPGLSSVQLLAARLRRPWQDWTLRSAHGAACDPVAAVSEGRAAFFLTGGANTPATLCRALTEAGLGFLRAVVGERLSYPDERLTEATAAECAEMRFDPLSVLLVEAAPRPVLRAGGFPDGAFIRGDVPMTKQLVRAAILAALGVRPGETVWDVGAGTGSVSVELALAARGGRVFAVERRAQACELIRRNRAAFGAWNLTVVEGEAPEALSGLGAPDAVFIGGSGGVLPAIVDAALERSPDVRLCMTAVALETLSEALRLCGERGLSAEVTQLAVSRTRTAAGMRLLTANNPVFVILIARDGTERAEPAAERGGAAPAGEESGDVAV